MTHPMIFGIKIKTILWFLIAVVLGLIFSMTMWPKWWRKFYEKKRLKRIAKLRQTSQPKKKHKFAPKIAAALIILICLTTVFLIGTEVGFKKAVENMPSPPACPEHNCSPIKCEDLHINCPICRCFLCSEFVKIQIPIK